MEVQTEKKTYTIPEWMWPLVEDLCDFDLDFILETCEKGKNLLTPEKVVFS